MARRKAWRRLLVGMLLLVVLSTISLLHILGGPRRFVEALLSIRLTVFLVSFLLLFIAEIVKSFRLTLIADLMGYRIPLKDSLIARISGRFTGVLTPAYSAATPTRAIILSAYTGLEPGRTFGFAVYESVLDSFIPVGFTLALLIPLLPRSIIPVLVALFIVFMWVGGIGYASTDRIERLLRKYNAPEDLICYIERQRRMFVDAIKETTNLHILVPSILITILSHFFEALALYFTVCNCTSSPSPTMALHALILLEASYVLTMSPTPGGALFFEYGLADLMRPGALLAWRTVFLAFSLLPGLIILLTLKPVRRYIEEALVREVHGCESGGEVL